MDKSATLTGTLEGDINKNISINLEGLVSGSLEGPITLEIKLIPASGEPLFGEATID